MQVHFTRDCTAPVAKAMLCLSQTTGYGILACGCLGRCDQDWMLARDIARCTGIPLPYLSKVLNGLSSHGLVEAKRGYRGGFRLARPAAEMDLLQLVEAVEGAGWASRCLLGFEQCSDERACPTHAFWKRERRLIAAELAQISVADAAAFELARSGLTNRTCKPALPAPATDRANASTGAGR